MIRGTAMAIACLGAVSLAGCDERTQMAGAPNVCIDFKHAKPGAMAPGAEAAAPVEDCVRRWAYTLASSRDDADTVAAAVVAACGAPLSRWNQQTLSQPGADVEASSITTGAPTTPIAEHNAFTGGRALFYVVQARAGHCAPPPVKDGLPEGVIAG